MSLIDKIPPLVSALAFGYGVGMAAPDQTLATMQTAMVGTPPARQARPAPLLPPAGRLQLAANLPGVESQHLAELRGHGDSRHESSCRHDHRPGESRLRLESRNDDADEFVDDDELDEAESAVLSRLQLPDVPLSFSKQTLKYVRHFTRSDRGRDLFETWLKRSGRFQELIQTEFRARRLPEDLIWVAMIESGFDATAKSPAGAVGLWQFMPATGAVYGLKQNKFVDQRRNPKLATQAAAHHLRDLYMRFGQWDLAMAAYNMGYEQLLDRIDRVGSTDFNELVRHRALPEETSKYVPKILAAAIVANNLDRFGFDEVELMRSTDTAELSVPPRTPLETIAKAAGVSTATIRKFNPDILGKELPPGKGDYLVNVPADSIQRAIAMLPTMLDLSRSQSDEVDVLDPVDLMSPDGYRPPAVEDESLLSYLPKPKKKRKSMRSPMEEGVEERLEDLADATHDEEEPKKKKDTIVYRAGGGETIAEIARQFDVDPRDVARENGMKVEDKVEKGALIRLRVPKGAVDSDARSRTGSADDEDKKAKRPAKG
jgi:membrane-bound lytic murein transglycosylase D